MNLVPIEAWSFSKVHIKSWGLCTTASYAASGKGYARELEAASFMGRELLPMKDVDAINYLVISIF